MSVIFWTELPVDETLSDSVVLEVVGDIQKVDALTINCGQNCHSNYAQSVANPNMNDSQQITMERLFPKKEEQYQKGPFLRQKENPPEEAV